MTVQELTARFPEIPTDLHGEPVLAALADTCGPLLAEARKPSACATQYDAANQYYLALITPIGIYGYGLSKREALLQQLQALVDRQRADPAGFAASLLPNNTAVAEVKGAGCS
jgi:hypothetical protein